MGGSRKSQLLFSCGVVLILAQPAWADFIGIIATTKDDPDTVALCNNAEGDLVPFPLTVCNIFAAFDAPLDRLLGIEITDLQVYDGKTPDVFFQHPFNSAVIAPTCTFVGFFPDLICDTFVTIGHDCGPEPAGTDGTDTDGDFDADEFNFNGHIVGGWFDASPPNGKDCACWIPLPLKVLFLQASVAQGHTVSGTVDIRWKDAFTNDIMVEQGVFVECTLGCDTDLDGDGTVGASDLAQLLGAWGPCSGCPADLNSDDVVNAADLAMLLGTWGPCG